MTGGLAFALSLLLVYVGIQPEYAVVLVRAQGAHALH
jgi:hypothetical protein